MRKNFLAALAMISVTGLSQADDFQMTGPKAQAIKKEIIALDQENLEAMKRGPASGEFYDKHQVDSILYLGGLDQTLTKPQLVKEWRDGVRPALASTARHYDYRVRVYENGSVAILDFVGDMGPKWIYKGKQLPSRGHVQEVFIKHDGVWRMVVQDRFPIADNAKR